MCRVPLPQSGDAVVRGMVDPSPSFLYQLQSPWWVKYIFSVKKDSEGSDGRGQGYDEGDSAQNHSPVRTLNAQMLLGQVHCWVLCLFVQHLAQWDPGP